MKIKAKSGLDMFSTDSISHFLMKRSHKTLSQLDKRSTCTLCSGRPSGRSENRNIPNRGCAYICFFCFFIIKNKVQQTHQTHKSLVLVIISDVIIRTIRPMFGLVWCRKQVQNSEEKEGILLFYVGYVRY